MKIHGMCIIILITAFVSHSTAISYNFVSAKCLDVNKEIFTTELCSIKGSNFSVITKINGPLNKINVRLTFDLEFIYLEKYFRSLLASINSRKLASDKFSEQAGLNGARLCPEHQKQITSETS